MWGGKPREQRSALDTSLLPHTPIATNIVATAPPESLLSAAPSFHRQRGGVSRMPQSVQQISVQSLRHSCRLPDAGGDDPLEGVLLDRVRLKGRKRAKLRIDPGKTAGLKVVFDEEGQAMQPLERLSQAELGR